MGFVGGVPPNTETAAVNPRVGVVRHQEVKGFGGLSMPADPRPSVFIRG